jgi:hypothetical protein
MAESISGGEVVTSPSVPVVRAAPKPVRVSFLKPILFVCLAAIVAAVAYGLYIYLFEPFSPAEQIAVSNVTGRSATITWITEEETKGVAIVNETGNFNAGILSGNDSKVAYDDRDRSKLELEQAEADQEVVEEVDEASVDYQAVREIISPHAVGRYLVHHVTVSGLDPETTYYFSIGNGYRMESTETMTFATYADLDDVVLPDPAYGTVTTPDGSMANQAAVSDAVVFLTVRTGDGVERSGVLSAVVAENGSWYIDLSSARNDSGEVYWDRFTSAEVNSMFEDLTVVTGKYETKSRSISIHADSPAYPIVVGSDSADVPEETLEGASDLCQGAETEGDPCWINYSQVDPYGEGNECSYTCMGKGYCNTAGLCVNEWTPGSSCQKDDEMCASACDGGVQCYEGQVCSDGSSPNCCTAECQWVFQESSSVPTGESLVSSLNGTETLGVFDTVVTPVEAGSCSCDCGGSQGSYASVYCGTTGVTDEQTFEDGCYKIVEHCNAESLDGGNTCNTNHTYFEKGTKKSSSSCDGSGVTQPDSGVQQPSAGSGSSACYCDGQDVQGNWINCYFDEAAASQALQTCQQVANDTGDPQQLWCNSPNASNLKKTESLYSQGLEDKTSGVLGEESVLSASSGITCHGDCENVENCGNGCTPPQTPTTTTTYVCCQFNLKIGTGKQSWEKESDCTMNGGTVRSGMTLSECEDAITPTPTDEDVCCEFNTPAGSVHQQVRKSDCDVTVADDYCVDPKYVCCGGQENISPTMKPENECSISDILNDQYCDSGNPSATPESQNELESGCSINPWTNSIKLNDPCNCLVGCYCDEDTGGVDDYVQYGWTCSLSASDCQASDGTPTNEGSDCTLLGLPGTSEAVCQDGKCVRPVAVESGAWDDVAKDLGVRQRNKWSLLNVFDHVFAQNSEVTVENGIILVPAMGVYTLTFGQDYYVQGLEVGTSEDMPIFVYVDKNDIVGYQAGEDDVLDISAYTIGLEKTAGLVTYHFVPGFNIVSFPLVIDNLETAVTASSLLEYLNGSYNNAFYSIATFESGRWLIIENRNGSTYGSEDFQIVPGRGYVLKTKRDVVVDFSGKMVAQPVPVSFIEGWNLIGLHGVSNGYTASQLIESVDSQGTLDANNVTRWRSGLSRYEGLQVETDAGGNTQEYGFDFNLSPIEGYFVRIADGRGDWIPED